MRVCLFVATLSLAVSLTGCGAFRAQVGYGFGAGAAVKVPALLQVGLGFGFWRHFGPDYGPVPSIVGIEPDEVWDMNASIIFKGQHEEAVRRYRNHEFIPITGMEHDARNYNTYMLLPIALLFDGYTYQYWPLELHVMLVAFDLRIGFNPYFLFYDVPDPEDAFDEEETEW